ncbi:hypothetical protein BC834DRAFT_360103 [Gloeopeniophorella convolvens]|nr:hypothetical protein BC834DRAFT_360103 [Gloeopeniophorella convolvens]
MPSDRARVGCKHSWAHSPRGRYAGLLNARQWSPGSSPIFECALQCQPPAGPVPPSRDAGTHGPPQHPAAHTWAHRGTAWDTQPPPPITQSPPANQGGLGGPAEPSARIVWIHQNGARSMLVLFEITQRLECPLTCQHPLRYFFCGAQLPYCVCDL